MNEVPQARVHLQPFTVGTKVALIAWRLADCLICAGAAFRGFEGAEGQFPLLPCLVMVATGQTPWSTPVGVCVDPLALSCSMQAKGQIMCSDYGLAI